MIGDPLDGSNNPDDTRLGDSLADITGVVTQAFGFYRILPTTNITILKSQEPATHPPTTLISNGKCDQITFGSYNAENLSPNSKILPSIASHIVNYLKTPSLMFLQEIQDNNGATNNGGKCDITLITKII